MYAPVVKLSSVWILLAYTNHYDLEIMSFNVKTAFLHAHSPYDIFIKQIPGFPEANTSTVLCLLVTFTLSKGRAWPPLAQGQPGLTLTGPGSGQIFGALAWPSWGQGI